ncbi:hypothetical protein CPZ06_10580, partial [Lactobacillus acidophilus]
GAGADRAAGGILHRLPARGAERHAVILGRRAVGQGCRRHPRLSQLAAGTEGGQGHSAEPEPVRDLRPARWQLISCVQVPAYAARALS